MEARASFLVGLVLLVAGGSLAGFVAFTQKDVYGDSNTYSIYGDFDDASGIRPKTRIQINGIDVGKIASIKHYRRSDGRLVARVEIRLLKEFELYRDASLKKAAESLLGDFRLDLYPGTPSVGVLAADSVITDVESKTDLQQLQTELRAVAGNVRKITDSFASVLAGEKGTASLQGIVEGIEASMASIQKTTAILERTVGRNEDVLNGLLTDIRYFARELATSAEPTGRFTVALRNVASLTDRLDRIATSIDEMVNGEDTDSEFSVRSTLENVGASAQHINAITRKINDGQGTLGRLINDRGVVDKLEQTLEDTSEVIGNLSRIKMELELRSEYAVPVKGATAGNQAGIKNYMQLRLYPKPDKYYLIEAVSDPRGVQRRTVETTTSDSSGGEYYEDKTVTEFNDLKFSLQFAKRYYFATLRFGFIENTGGLGINFHALDDKIEFRFDVFDFNRRDLTQANQPVSPRLRGMAMFEVVDHVFIQAGMDDPLNEELFSWFVGGGIRFTDKDLRGLLLLSPKSL